MRDLILLGYQCVLRRLQNRSKVSIVCQKPREGESYLPIRSNEALDFSMAHSCWDVFLVEMLVLQSAIEPT